MAMKASWKAAGSPRRSLIDLSTSSTVADSAGVGANIRATIARDLSMADSGFPRAPLAAILAVDDQGSETMKQPQSMRALEELGRVRLSKNFFMRDFLYSEVANFYSIL